MQNLGKLFKSGKKRNTRKRPNTRKGLQSQKMGHVYSVNSGPVFAPNMPKEFSVSLVDRQSVNAAIPAAAPAAFYSIYGLLEFLNKRPLYCNELYLLYKFARVTAVQYHFEIINTGVVPIEAMFAVCPYADAVVPPTPQQLGEKPGVVRHIISPAGGMDRRSISKTCKAEDWFGNPYFTRDYWVNAAQSVSATPLDVDEPVGLFCLASTANIVGAQATYISKITYHIQFFDLELNQPNLNTHFLEDQEDMVMVPTPKKLVPSIPNIDNMLSPASRAYISCLNARK